MQTPSQRQRAVSALAVLLLHVLLLFALLHFLVKPQSARLPSTERLLEFIISTPKISPPTPMPDRPRQRQAPVRASPVASRRAPCPLLPRRRRHQI